MPDNSTVETGDAAADDAEFEVSIIAFGKRLAVHPNVHAVLSFSALLIVLHLMVENGLHGELTAVLLAEVAHFLGWVWLELPEAIELG